MSIHKQSIFTEDETWRIKEARLLSVNEHRRKCHNAVFSKMYYPKSQILWEALDKKTLEAWAAHPKHQEVISDLDKYRPRAF